MKITEKVKETIGDEAFGKLKEILGGKELYLLEEKDYIPKNKFNDIISENKKLKDSVTEAEKKLHEMESEEGKKSKTLEEQLAEMKSELNKLAETSKQKDEELLREKKMSFLKDKLVAAKVNPKYLKHAMSEFEIDKIDIDDEEGIKAIDERTEKLKETYPDFFGEEQISGAPPAGGGGEDPEGMKELSTEDFIAEVFNGE